MSVSVPRAKPIASSESIDCNGAILPLENGDRLTRDEFVRRYEAMPELKRAELIEGVVYVPSPVRQQYHGLPHTTLIGWLFNYRAKTPGVEPDNSTVLLDVENAPQPDCLLYIQPGSGGQVRLVDGYVAGAPDLVAEIAASSVSYDLHDKLKAFERNGIREYIVWRVFDRQIDWFVRREERYERLFADEDGILRSTVFPGLWLDPHALLRDDFDTLLRVLDRGLNSPEHAAFVTQLQKAAGEAAH